MLPEAGAEGPLEMNSQHWLNLFGEIQHCKATENILWFCFYLNIISCQRQLLLQAQEVL